MTNAVATLSEIKSYLKLPDTLVSDDSLITALSDAVYQFMQTYTGRSILSASYTDTYNGKNELALPLRQFPITDISSVTIDNVVQQPAASPTGYGYVFDDNMVYIRGGRFTRGVQNIVVGYTAGYATVPLDWKQAHIELVAYKYKARDHVGTISTSTGGVVTTSFMQKDVPPEVMTVLNNYLRVTV